MFVNQSGTGYMVYVKNDFYANKILKANEAESNGDKDFKLVDQDFRDYFDKIVDSIPELRDAEAAGIGIGFMILPETASNDLKQTVSMATNKMIEDNTDPDILKAVLGVIKESYTASVEQNDSSQIMKNIDSTYETVYGTYDNESLTKLYEKFSLTYDSSPELSEAINKFTNYLTEIFDLIHGAENGQNTESIFSASGEVNFNEKKGQIFNTSV